MNPLHFQEEIPHWIHASTFPNGVTDLPHISAAAPASSGDILCPNGQFRLLNSRLVHPLFACAVAQVVPGPVSIWIWIPVSSLALVWIPVSVLISTLPSVSRPLLLMLMLKLRLFLSLPLSISHSMN
jgi:hypothetical protein